MVEMRVYAKFLVCLHCFVCVMEKGFDPLVTWVQNALRDSAQAL